MRFMFRRLRFVLFSLLMVALYCVLRVVYDAFTCTPIYDRLITMPNGISIPLYADGPFATPLGSFLSRCDYHDSEILQCKNVKQKGETAMRQLQLSYIRMLRIVDVMSKRSGFDYWLWSGTLLGAVRQSRLNPWDEDADICMLRKDYEIFVKHAATDLPKDVYLQTVDNELAYAHASTVADEAKLRDTNTCYGFCARTGCTFHDGFQVDIIVLDTGNGEEINDKFNRFHINRNDVFPLDRHWLEGFEFNVPRQASLLLQQMYGDFRRPPNKRWQCTNFVGVPWSSCEEVARMNESYRSHMLYDTMMKKYPRLSGYISF